MDLFEILSFSKSLMVVDVSPHLVDFENLKFCYAPVGNSNDINPQQMLSLTTLLNSFAIKDFSLRGSILTDDVMDILYDFLGINSSLISIDLSYCGLSDEHVSGLISALQSNPCSKLSIIDLQNNSIGFVGAIAFTSFLEGNSTIIEIVLRNNSIDIEHYEHITRMTHDRIKLS
ncbi:hypothetical protein GEMRC1_012666 [Eukaryota sp. GEM-RC1]